MKRVVIKQGDIFSIETEKGKRYFQYICKDAYQLNGNVIRVFKDDTMTDVEFYIHTIISIGVKQYGWVKVGNGPVPDISNVVFFTDVDMAAKLYVFKNQDANWRIWTVSGNEKIVKELPEYRCEEGSVYPPCCIMDVICGKDLGYNRDMKDMPDL